MQRHANQGGPTMTEPTITLSQYKQEAERLYGTGGANHD